VSPEERSALVRFIWGLREFLRRLLFARGGIPPPLRPRFEAALSELDNRRVFENLTRAIESRDYDGPLADHGLTGEELRLKMILFDVAVLDYDRERHSRFARFRPWREAEAGRRVLEIADKILGSITAATPVAGADAAEELKQAFEWALGLWKRWRTRRSWPAEWDGIQPF
jgi:hypothetical protein